MPRPLTPRDETMIANAMLLGDLAVVDRYDARTDRGKRIYRFETAEGLRGPERHNVAYAARAFLFGLGYDIDKDGTPFRDNPKE